MLEKRKRIREAGETGRRPEEEEAEGEKREAEVANEVNERQRIDRI